MSDKIGNIDYSEAHSGYEGNTGGFSVSAETKRLIEAEVKAIVDEAAESYEHPEEVVRWYYAQPQRLSEIEGVAIEDNVVAWALSSAKVIDKPIAFDELMGQS